MRRHSYDDQITAVYLGEHPTGAARIADLPMVRVSEIEHRLIWEEPMSARDLADMARLATDGDWIETTY
jgi:hypothetical protein